MYRKRLLIYLVAASVVALGLTLALDVWLASTHAFSYTLWLCGAACGQNGAGSHALSAIRDALLGNLLFFLLVGVAVAVATSRDPRAQSFQDRLRDMFPRLDAFGGLIDPIANLVKEDASVATRAEITFTFNKYHPDIKAYEVSVVKRERIVSLLASEPYEDNDYQIVVDADVVDGHDRLGEVTEAKVTMEPPENSNGVTITANWETIDFITGQAQQLTPAQPSWRVEDRTVKIPVGLEGQTSLKYWVFAKASVPFTSTIRRPTREIVVKIVGNIPRADDGARLGDIEVHPRIKGDAANGNDKTESLDPHKGHIQRIFRPTRRRPVFRIEFSLPGAKLAIVPPTPAPKGDPQ